MKTFKSKTEVKKYMATEGWFTFAKAPNVETETRMEWDDLDYPERVVCKKEGKLWKCELVRLGNIDG
jgi:hypothetical protein